MTVVADSHLSARTPEAVANWEAVAKAVHAGRPDLVLHLGDASLDGSSGDEDLHLVRELLDALPVPWRAIPGNHDIGDNPNPDTTEEHNIRAGRVDAWRRLFGPDYWSADLDSWTLLALNGQLFGSGLPAEAQQWAWLEATLDALPSDRALVLANHKPIEATAEDEAVSPAYRFVPQPARARLVEMLDGRNVPVVLSGHVHQYRQLVTRHSPERRHVWVPTTWAVIPGQPVFGTKRCGVLSLTLGPGGNLGAEMVEPAGIAQQVLGDNIPNPYA